MLIPANILRGERLETIVTSMFMHGGVIHLVFNMYFAWVFCDDLENVYGHWFFLVFYILCGVGAAIIHILFTLAVESIWHLGLLYVPCLGASGALFGVLAAYGFFFPRRKLRIVYLYGQYTITARNFAIIYAVIETLMIVFSVIDNVAHTAHVGGFITGLAIAYIHKRLTGVKIE